MTQSTKATPTPASLPALVRPKNPAKILSRDLASAVAVYTEMVKRGELNLIPRGMTAEGICAHLQKHLDEELLHGKATKEQAAAVTTRDQLEAQAREERVQVVDLVDANYPPETPERCDFFPKNQKGKALSQFVIALGEGTEKHGLPGLPLHMTGAGLLDLGHRLEAAEQARDAAGVQKTTSATARQNLEPGTADIATRLAGMVRGHYGRTSKELLAYGLKVQTAPAARKAPRKVKKAGVTPQA